MTFLNICARYRYILAILGLTSSIALLLTRPTSFTNFVKADYLAWVSSTLIAAALLGDIYAFYKNFGYSSTLTLDLIALVILFTGRIGSLTYSLIRSSFLSPIIGGGIFDSKAYAIALLIPLAAFEGTPVILLHAIMGKPVTLAPSPCYAEIFNYWKEKLGKLAELILNHPIFTAFAIGFTVRLIPELYWWPWHIGWDTVEYMAHLEDFLQNPGIFKPYPWMRGVRNLPPLLDLILAPVALLVGSWLTFKFYASVAYGFLTASTAYLSEKVLKLDKKYTLLAAVASAFYILNLRISWDYLRQLLGSIFMILSIISIETHKNAPNPQKHVASATITLLAALSHEVTAAVSATLLLLLTINSSRQHEKITTTVYATAFTATIILLLWYSKMPIRYNPYLGAAPPGVVYYSNPTLTIQEVVSYFIVGYGILIPMALVAASRYLHRKYYLLSITVLFMAGLSPLIAPYTAITTWYRFMIAASPLLTPLAVAGAAEIGQKQLAAVYLAIIVITGAFFGLLPNGGAYTVKIVNALREFPQSLTPSPSNKAHLEDLAQLSQYVKKLDSSTPILAESYVARWIHLGIRNPKPGQIIWTWKKPSIWIVCNMMHKYNTTKIYIVTLDNLEKIESELENAKSSAILCGPYNITIIEVSIENIRDNIYKIYLVTLHKE